VVRGFKIGVTKWFRQKYRMCITFGNGITIL
jgi:hypothetical protein